MALPRRSIRYREASGSSVRVWHGSLLLRSLAVVVLVLTHPLSAHLVDVLKTEVLDRTDPTRVLYPGRVDLRVGNIDNLFLRCSARQFAGNARGPGPLMSDQLAR